MLQLCSRYSLQLIRASKTRYRQPRITRVYSRSETLAKPSRPVNEAPETPAPPKSSPLAPSPPKSGRSRATGADIARYSLLRNGVSLVFGYPGGAIAGIMNAVCNDPNITVVMPRHEQGAGHMAEGYARTTRKPGVLLVTSGPGTTNLVTPIQDAMSDGVPLVVLAGQIPINARGTEAFQEADISSMMRACTKWTVTVDNVKSLGPSIDEAFKVASSGRPGPVLLEIPSCVAKSSFSINTSHAATPHANLITLSNPPPPDAIDHIQLQKAASLINNAEKPLVIAGAGVLASLDGQRLLAQLAEVGNIPVATTLHGLGAFNEDDPRSLHMIGMHGSAYGNYAVQSADVILALGARLDERVTGSVDSFAPVARTAGKDGHGGIIRFEIDPARLTKLFPAEISIIGDVTDNLASLIPLIRHRRRTAWSECIDAWKAKFPFTYEKGKPTEPLKPQSIIEELDRQTAHLKDVTITTGVGHHQMWTAQHITWSPHRRLITSGGFGTMGFGLPAAIGAKLGDPSRTVIDIDGDGSFLMTAMELATAAEKSIGVKVLVLNNSGLSKVRWHGLLFEELVPSRMVNPDFVKLAQSMGVHGIRCSAQADMPEKLKEFLEYDNSRPVVMECLVAEGEDVWPIVFPGKALHQLALHPSFLVDQH